MKVVRVARRKRLCRASHGVVAWGGQQGPRLERTVMALAAEKLSTESPDSDAPSYPQIRHAFPVHTQEAIPEDVLAYFLRPSCRRVFVNVPGVRPRLK